MIVVADASPLRYLIQIDEAELLPALFGSILTAPAVMRELSQERTPVEVRQWVAAPPEWLRVRIPAASRQPFPAALGPGECAAIALAEEVHADVVLVDDGLARREGVRRRLSIQGTLGTLGLAARHGLTDLPRAINRRRATNFRMSDSLIESILGGYGESGK